MCRRSERASDRCWCTNNGLMRAQNGGTLILDGSSGATFTNNATIRSENGSNVSILFSTLGGGTLDNTGSSGTLTLNFGTLRDVTIAAGSTVTTGANTDGRLENTLVNHGISLPRTMRSSTSPAIPPSRVGARSHLELAPSLT